MLKKISGGVCASKGFSANGVHCGIRKSRTKRDLSLILSSSPASCASVYTQNLVKGAPLVVTKENIADGIARAVICNSGNANTCNANGVQIAKEMCASIASELKIKPTDVVVASTGVIGEPLNIDVIKKGIPELVKGLSESEQGSLSAAEGIMTTDTRVKEVAYSFNVDGVECHIGGIAKGSGMIHPNMATMLVFITSDVSVESKVLNKMLSQNVKETFNMLSIDGDTSTNDMVSVLANGLAGNKTITSEKSAGYAELYEALNAITSILCREIARDGEGATKLLEAKVSGAPSLEIARVVAKSVICSSLVKAAMFGSDANWGRVLCAIGYSGADVDVHKVELSFKSSAGDILVCKEGSGVKFSEEKAKQILTQDEIEILIDLHFGKFNATAWGCDLTYDYVKINGDYRT